MQRTSAPNIEGAPLPHGARGYWNARFLEWSEELEKLLEAERAQLPPWLVVGFGTGIAAWFALDLQNQWAAFLCAAAAIALLGFGFGNGRAGRALGCFALAATLGCSLVWVRSAWVAEPRLSRAEVVDVTGRVESVDYLAAKDAIRLVVHPAGALVVLLFRPEALAVPSFQMSFAAVTAIVALHSMQWAQRLFQRREEGVLMRIARATLATIATGLTVEVALAPLALYHFHRTGLYGVGANIVAIPLTTFVIMPLEAGALLLAVAGWGKPLWFLCGTAINFLLALAHPVADAKGAVALLPSMPGWAFAVMVGGGTWLCLWTKAWQMAGLVPIAIGAVGAALSPAPDLLVTGDGMHLAVVGGDGTPLILRDRAGDYVRGLFAEASGFDGDTGDLGSRPYSDCSNDAGVAVIEKATSQWRPLATRSAYQIDWKALTQACAEADIVVSNRRLPRACTPRWLKLDPAMLRRTGGLAIYLGENPWVESPADHIGEHPWVETKLQVRIQ